MTHAVTVQGQPLAAGTYGLHMIPGQDEWTVVFSKFFAALIFYLLCWLPWGLFLIALRDPRAKNFTPETFMDLRFVKEVMSELEKK